MSNKKRILQNEKGDALIVVLCIMMVFFVLALSTLLAASVMQGSAKKDAVSERCKIAALSYNEMLDYQLTAAETTSNDEGSVKALFRTLMLEGGADKVYNSNGLEDLQVTQLLAGLDGYESGKTLSGYNIRVQTYWEGNSENIRKIKANPDKEKAYNGLKLYIEVTCTKGSESYKVRSEYAVSVGGDATIEWTYKLGGRY